MSDGMTSVAIDERAALDLLFDVLRVDSIWGRERALAEMLAGRMRAAGCVGVALVEPLPGRPSVVGIPTVNIGSGGPPYNWADEHVTVDEYLAAVRTYAATLADFCNREP